VCAVKTQKPQALPPWLPSQATTSQVSYKCVAASISPTRRMLEAHSRNPTGYILKNVKLDTGNPGHTSLQLA